MLEKQYQTKFNLWCKYEFRGNAVFELKKGDTTIRFDAVQEHQEHALYNVKHSKIVFKIPDLGSQNPFDSFQMENAGAYVVLFFTSLHKTAKGFHGKEFFMIDIDVWLKEKKESKKKSIGIARAREIGFNRMLKPQYKFIT